MKLSLDWLSDFVQFNERDPHKIAETLTLSVAEIEKVEVQGELLTRCVVGKVITLEKHPNADSLSLCEVQTDQGVKRVICGGTNLRKGMRVAFAHVGATVRSHEGEIVTLRKAKIRGEESNGMICAAEELDLQEHYPPTPEQGKRPVVDFGEGDEEIGQPLRDYVGMTDIVFHVDNHSITHRPDLFSHIGFARECVATGLGSWKRDPSFPPPRFGKDKIPFQFIVEEPNLMPRYCSCMIHIDGVGETPEWMRKRLHAVGWRSLNLPIDITNYVASEVGVPLHSFDADDIKGAVHMRTAKQGETIVTLDEKKRALPEGALVLSDDKGIFDLMGIMGGLRSSTKESTRRIYLHSASLSPVAIRNTIIATGHRTDAATVYEKGVPHITAEQGFYRAVQLFIELVPGATIASKMDSYGDNGSPKSIMLSTPHVSSVLGREISGREVEEALLPLDFEVKSKGDTLNVTPPLHRLGSIRESADVIEEVARISGFASFAEEMPLAAITPPEREHRLHRIRSILKEAGFVELVRFAFLGADLLQKSGMEMNNLEEIENPLGEDMKYMRPSLLPRLFEFAEENVNFVEDRLRAFEIGHIFSRSGESPSLALITVNRHGGGLREEPFLFIKLAVSEFLRKLNLHCIFEKEKKRSAMEHPARSVCLSSQGKEIGKVFEIHPLLTKNFDFPGRAAVAVMDVDRLLSLPKEERVFEEIPEYPSITYDTTVSLKTEVEVAPLLEKVRRTHTLLRHVELIDLFQKEGARHLTFRCTYTAPDRTLTEEEVKPIHGRVEAALQGA